MSFQIISIVMELKILKVTSAGIVASQNPSIVVTFDFELS
jgi:hypothetical protein